jgi:tagatose 1,6-diphosphate aldolase
VPHARSPLAPPAPPGPAPPFAFRDPGALCDGELSLVLDYRSPCDPERGWTPAYHFGLLVGGRRAGGVELRVGRDARHERVTGHLGYFVTPGCRGRGYAARAVQLLVPLARAHGLDPLWILCEPRNRASRRTCERIGAALAGLVRLPDGVGGARRYRLRYRLDVGAPDAAEADPAPG